MRITADIFRFEADARQIGRLRLAAGLSLLLLMASLGSSSAQDIFSTPRTGKLPWGLYQILWSGPVFLENLDRNTAIIGDAPQFVLFFRDLERPFPAEICREIHARGAIPVISLELVHWGGPSDDRLEAIIAGQYDEVFQENARAVQESGDVVLYRFGFEMNGDWFAWGGQPENFIAAWQHVHQIFQAAGATNLKWVWAPNAISGPNTPENGIEKYWPGSEYVDVIGLDGYNFGESHSQWHSWVECRQVFEPALDKIRESGVPHPVLITEFGCTSERTAAQRARWIEEAHEFFAARPEIIGAIWFNLDKRREGEPNWRLDADPESLSAWQRTFAAP